MSPGVGALLVEVAQVALEVPAERGEVWHERAREGRTPALFEDRALRPLDAAVALRTPGGNEPLRGAQVADRLAEARMDELVPVVGGHRAQPAARRLKFRRDASRTQTGLTEGRGNDLLLKPARDLVGHARRPALPWTQDDQTVALDERLPVVIGRAMKAEFQTGATNTDLLGAREQLQPVAIDEVIIGHEAVPPLWWLKHPKDGPPFVVGPKSNLSGRLVGRSD